MFIIINGCPAGGPPTVLFPLHWPKYQEQEGAEPISIAGPPFVFVCPFVVLGGTSEAPPPLLSVVLTGALPFGRRALEKRTETMRKKEKFSLCATTGRNPTEPGR